jgi:hypothetical protein
MKWFYWNDDREVGPITDRALQELGTAGVISSDTPIRQENAEEWTNLALLSATTLPSRHQAAGMVSETETISLLHKDGRKATAAWIIGGSVAILLAIAVIMGLVIKGRNDKTMVSGLIKEADHIAIQTEGEQDWERMVSLLRKAVEKGSHEAEYKLGACYFYGRGVPKDAREAARLYGRAAKGGVAEAQYNLSVCYGRGEGVERNDEEMLKWLKLAEQQKLPIAQYFLGNLNLHGEAVPQNKQRGIELISAAALQGVATAQYELSVCHEFGTGLTRDVVQAYKWAIISIRSGYAREDEALRAEVVEKLRSQMTTAQISEGERLANEWKPEASPK